MGCVQSAVKEPKEQVATNNHKLHSESPNGHVQCPVDAGSSFQENRSEDPLHASRLHTPENSGPFASAAYDKIPQVYSEHLPVRNSLGDSSFRRHRSLTDAQVQHFQQVTRCESLSQALAPIVNHHSGQLNNQFSRQLSSLSTCSLTSDGGSMVVSHEDGSTPVKLKRLIGTGGCGKVYLASYDEKLVAVKVITGYSTLAPYGLSPPQGTSPETLKELAMQEQDERKERMTQLEAVLMAIVDHPNLIKTYKVMASNTGALEQISSGVQTHEPPVYQFFILMEYAAQGSLWAALLTNRLHRLLEPLEVALRLQQQGPEEQRASSFTQQALRDVMAAQVAPADEGSYHIPAQEVVQWDAWASLEMLKEVASALMYLHENGIIHGDLKVANVLLSNCDKDRRGFVAKLTDFGFSRIMRPRGHINTRSYGTVTHMPPELLSDGVLTTSTDVYSFGIVMWEVFCADGVFKELSDTEVIFKVVCSHLRPVFPPDVPPRYKDLAERCWSSRPEDRPDLSYLVSELVAMQQELCPEGPDSAGPLLARPARTQRRHKSSVSRTVSASCVGQVQGSGASGSAAAGTAGAATAMGPSSASMMAQIIQGAGLGPGAVKHNPATWHGGLMPPTSPNSSTAPNSFKQGARGVTVRFPSGSLVPGGPGLPPPAPAGMSVPNHGFAGSPHMQPHGMAMVGAAGRGAAAGLGATAAVGSPPGGAALPSSLEAPARTAQRLLQKHKHKGCIRRSSLPVIHVTTIASATPPKPGPATPLSGGTPGQKHRLSSHTNSPMDSPAGSMLSLLAKQEAGGAGGFLPAPRITPSSGVSNGAQGPESGPTSGAAGVNSSGFPFGYESGVPLFSDTVLDSGSGSGMYLINHQGGTGLQLYREHSGTGAGPALVHAGMMRHSPTAAPLSCSPQLHLGHLSSSPFSGGGSTSGITHCSAPLITNGHSADHSMDLFRPPQGQLFALPEGSSATALLKLAHASEGGMSHDDPTSDNMLTSPALVGLGLRHPGSTFVDTLHGVKSASVPLQLKRAQTTAVAAAGTHSPAGMMFRQPAIVLPGSTPPTWAVPTSNQSATSSTPLSIKRRQNAAP